MARAFELKLGGTLKLLLEEMPASQAGVFITVKYDAFTITAKGDSMGYTLPADRRIAVKVSYVDANGHPATVDGDVTWDSSNPEIASVQAQADSTEAVVTPVGEKVGQCQISATADADLGDGKRELITLMDLTVVGGEAVAGVITPVGEPQPFPQPKPKA